MGSNWSRLKRAVEKGEESRALELYTKSTDIRRKLNANSIINDYTLDTYMHVSARHGMHEFLKLLLYENSGNPNKMNKRKQTVLHKVCEGSVDTVQYECMQLLLQWHDPTASASQLMLAAGSPTSAANHHNHKQQTSSRHTTANTNLPQKHPQAHQKHSTSHMTTATTMTSQPPNLAHNSLLVDINVNAKDEVNKNIFFLYL